MTTEEKAQKKKAEEKAKEEARLKAEAEAKEQQDGTLALAESKKVVVGYELNDYAKTLTGRVNVIFRGRKKPSSVRLLLPKELVTFARKLKRSDIERFLKPIYR